jgi:23S rRNA pseudouridine1911/1915/1917 synthase
MPQEIAFDVPKAGVRLDVLVTERLGTRLTRSQVQALIKEGNVTVNGAAIKPGIKLRGGERVVVTLPDPPVDPGVQPEAIPLVVLYEDRDLAVIDKPAGLVVHPGAGVSSGTLVNAILARYPEIEKMRYEPVRRGIVHRLDKDTSGLIVIARRDGAQQRLMRQFQKRTVEKRYLTLLEKTPATQTGRITAPIARDPANRRRMAVMRNGRPSESEYTVIEPFEDGRALVEVKLLTGRTHQIRVHMAFIGCPIVGDTVYGYRKVSMPIKRQFLHAHALCFDQPRSGDRLCFESPLPPELERIIEICRTKPR